MATISQEQLRRMLKNKPQSASDEDFVRVLVQRGHSIEGLELPSQKNELTQEKSLPTQLGERAKEATVGTVTGVSESLQSGDVIGAKRRLMSRPLGAVGRAVGDVAGRVISKILPDSFEQKLSETVEPIARPVLERFKQLEESNPELARDIEDAIGITELTGAASIARPLKSGVHLATPQKLREVTLALPEKSRESAVRSLTESFKDSFVENRKTLNSKLEKLASRQSFGGTKVTKDDLLQQLAEEGYVPEIEGKLANFTDTFEDIQTRQNSLAQEIDPLLEKVGERTSLDGLKQKTLEKMRESERFVENLPQAERELEKFFDSFEKNFGEDLTAQQVNQIRIAMNSRTRSFDKEAFTQDTANLVADSTRERIDELVPSGVVREANAEWGRLQGVKNTAEILHLEQIDVGFLGRALGSYAGTVLASGAGLSVAGPGGLVVAGIAAKYGGDALADFLRNKKFSPELRDKIKQEIRKDDELRKRLIQEASESNRKVLEAELN